MDDSNTVVSAYTMYKHLQQCCSHPSQCISLKISCARSVQSDLDLQCPQNALEIYVLNKVHVTEKEEITHTENRTSN